MAKRRIAALPGIIAALMLSVKLMSASAFAQDASDFDGTLLFEGVTLEADSAPVFAPRFGRSATFTVNSLLDTADASVGNGVCLTAGGVCTLRAAIQEANATAAADTILFQPGLSGEIVLSSAMPNISFPLTITGPGATVISVRGIGGTTSRTFNVTNAASATISGLTVTNSAGAIWNTSTGTVIVREMIIRNNVFTSAMSNTSANGTMRIENTASINNGGGSFTRGAASSGSMTIVNSTISGNSNSGGPTSVGAGVIAIGTASSIQIINSTIAGNSSAGGANIALANGGRATLSNTILGSPIVSGNCGTVGGGTFFSSGFNLVSDNSCPLAGSSDLLNTNPQLGTLSADYTNTTPVITLNSNSPALNSGSNAICATASTVNNRDQRGIPRPQFGICDRGALEHQEVLIVDRADDVNVGICTPNANDCALRGAVALSNGLFGRQIIQFDIPGTPHVITLASALPNLREPVTIDATTQSGYSGSGLPRIVLNGVSRAFDGLVLEGGTDGSLIQGLAFQNFNRGINIQSSGSRISANFIGTSDDGMSAAGNNIGILLVGVANNNIIGTNLDGVDDAAERNLIGGNLQAGIRIDGAGNQVNGNIIGRSLMGDSAIPNLDGVRILGSNNAVGAANNPAAANVIARNNGTGVLVEFGTGNAILGNSIYFNGALGIDHLNGGNTLQAAPSVSGVTPSGIGFALTSAPNADFRVEFFSSGACDPSGSGEGRNYLGFVNITTSGAGSASGTFAHTPTGGVAYTATAHRISTNNTSEFSNCVVYVPATPTYTPTATNTPTSTPTYTPTVDPCVPNPPNLIRNGDFSLTNGGNAPLCWNIFPPGALNWQIVGGVLNIHRVGTAGQTPSLIQATGASLSANATVEIGISLGNSAGTRRRVSILAHDADFSDLQLCAFWLDANQPTGAYTMTFSTREAWTNATISIYISDEAQSVLIDDVSMQASAGTSLGDTVCADPNAPAPGVGADSPNLLSNGDFNAPIGNANNNWGTFGTITTQITGGVLEMQRPSSDGATVLQNTNAATDADTPLELLLELGNSSPNWRRVALLIHEENFADSQACVFWLPPNAPLASYAMRTFANINWAETSVSIFISTIGTDGWVQMDNVSLTQRPTMMVSGIECDTPSGGPSLPLIAPNSVEVPTLEPTATVTASIPTPVEVLIVTPTPAPSFESSEGTTGE
jgi:CSLREA domain-containing protein